MQNKNTHTNLLSKCDPDLPMCEVCACTGRHRFWTAKFTNYLNYLGIFQTAMIYLDTLWSATPSVLPLVNSNNFFVHLQSLVMSHISISERKNHFNKNEHNDPKWAQMAERNTRRQRRSWTAPYIWETKFFILPSKSDAFAMKTIWAIPNNIIKCVHANSPFRAKAFYILSLGKSYKDREKLMSRFAANFQTYWSKVWNSQIALN